MPHFAISLHECIDSGEMDFVAGVEFSVVVFCTVNFTEMYKDFMMLEILESVPMLLGSPNLDEFNGCISKGTF